MGSGQSSRKLTISNEEGVGVIKLSNSIIERLAQAETSSASTSDVKPDVSNQQAPPPPGVATAPHQTAVTAPGQPVYYYPELTVSALKMQQQMEKELKQQDQYWQRRLQKLESGYQKLNAILEDEYKKAASETSDTKNRQVISDIQGAVQPCIENSDKILKCLQDHPKETLKCSNLVEEFSNCIWNVQYTYMIKV
ncbi:MICOS complex subunit Mic19 [Pseudomyrmex gracilis]|uniref:MICOS complex subunit Mic19 n=1 Tax=Pseudomyrmex gracilis TaxID=219809 RepID=UPI000994ABC2|nr:MICOS complex subunit Mic19 [Pseudomyrmex gracilis]XP_020291409.1 MICOS complex subunit Mic19 [Pseudomyrmex gracilis]